MDTSPLVMDEIDAGAEFLKQLHTYQPVQAACWMREGEDEERYLYVALEGLTNGNFDIAYGEVLRITEAMKDHYLDPFRVKLMTADDSVAKAILQIYSEFPARIPTRLNGRVFAGRGVVELYIYPPIHP